MEPVPGAKALGISFPAEAVRFHRLVDVLRSLVAIFCLALCVISASAQTTGNSSLSGVVADPTGAVVPGATVEIQNPVSQFDRSTTTDSAGKFSFPNIPFNPYHLNVSATGFAPYSQDVDVHSAVPLDPESHGPDSGDCQKALRSKAKRPTCWKTIRRSTPTWTGNCSTRFQWKATPRS